MKTVQQERAEHLKHKRSTQTNIEPNRSISSTSQPALLEPQQPSTTQTHIIITKHMCRHIQGKPNAVHGICSHSSIDITCGVHKNASTDNRVIPGVYKLTDTGLIRIPDNHVELQHLLTLSRTRLLKVYWPKRKQPSQEQFGHLSEVPIAQTLTTNRNTTHVTHDYLNERPSSGIRALSQTLHQAITAQQGRIEQVLGDGHCLRRAIGKIMNMTPAALIQLTIDICLA